MVLSAFTTQELVNVISSGDDRTLRGVKGIGPKAAARIIVELKDKVATLGITGAAATNAQEVQAEAQTSPVCEEAVAALVMLGFSPAPTTKVVKAILKDNPTYRVEEVIKVALKML
jgi:Holliday junction DNA helicase RuvA